MIRPLCCYDASGRNRIFGVRLWLFFQDPSDRRDTQMKPCSASRLGDLDLAHAGAQGFKTLHNVANEVRELIHWFAQLQQGIGAFVIDAFQPRCNRGRRDKEGVGRLFEGPATRSTKLEDRHALMRTVMRPPLRRDLRYACVLDAELFAQQCALFLKLVVLC